MKKKKAKAKTKSKAKPKASKRWQTSIPADTYKPHFTRQTEEYIARHGWDPLGLSKLFGVSDRTIHRWADVRSDFKAAVEAGQLRHQDERPDAEDIKEIEAALKQRAKGRTYVETQTVTGVDRKGKPIESTTTRVVQVEADVGAIRYFLNNRASERWRDRQEITLATTKEPPLMVLVMNRKNKPNVEVDPTPHKSRETISEDVQE